MPRGGKISDILKTSPAPMDPPKRTKEYSELPRDADGTNEVDRREHAKDLEQWRLNAKLRKS